MFIHKWIGSISLVVAELPTLTLSPCGHTILPVFTRTHATHPITHAKKKKKKKNDLGPRLVRSFSNSPMVLDGADGVYGWLHPEVSDRRRDTPKDNERNDHLEKSMMNLSWDYVCNNEISSNWVLTLLNFKSWNKSFVCVCACVCEHDLVWWM